MRVTILVCSGAALLQGVASAVGLSDRSLSTSPRSLGDITGSLSLRQDDDGGDDNDDGGDDGDDDGSNPPDNSDYLTEMCYGSFDTYNSAPPISTPCMAFEILDFDCQANGMLLPSNLYFTYTNIYWNRLRTNRFPCAARMYMRKPILF